MLAGSRPAWARSVFDIRNGVRGFRGHLVRRRSWRLWKNARRSVSRTGRADADRDSEALWRFAQCESGTSVESDSCRASRLPVASRWSPRLRAALEILDDDDATAAAWARRER